MRSHAPSSAQRLNERSSDRTCNRLRSDEADVPSDCDETPPSATKRVGLLAFAHMLPWLTGTLLAVGVVTWLSAISSEPIRLEAAPPPAPRTSLSLSEQQPTTNQAPPTSSSDASNRTPDLRPTTQPQRSEAGVTSITESRETSATPTLMTDALTSQSTLRRRIEDAGRVETTLAGSLALDPGGLAEQSGDGAGATTQVPSWRVVQRREPRLLSVPLLSRYYPTAARQVNLEGETTVRVWVDESGRVARVDAVESVPADVFDRAARRVARQLRFEPALIDGQPVASAFEVRLAWRLE